MLVDTFFDRFWWALSFPPKMFLKSLWFYPGWGKIMPKGGQKCPSVLKNDLMMLADISRLVLISTIFSVTTFLTPHWHSEPGKNMPKYGQNVKKRSNMLKIILWCWFLPCWWLLSFTLDFFLLPSTLYWRGQNIPNYEQNCIEMFKSSWHAQKWSYDVWWYLIGLVLIGTIFSNKYFLPSYWSLSVRQQNMVINFRKFAIYSKFIWFIPCSIVIDE